VKLFRSVGARLSLALALVVAAALAIVYAALVPTLKHRLVSAKLSALERAAPIVRSQYSRFDPDFTSTAAATADAQAAVLYGGLLSPSSPLLQIVDVSLPGSPSARLDEFERDPVALAAARSGIVESGTVERDEQRYAEVAVPLADDGRIVLLSASLRDTLSDVHLVQRRLLAFGGVALFAAILLGLAAAEVFARRLRRLERAAERIAAGDFSEPIVDAGSDEVGELARAFERMRGRLAQLDDARRAFIANASHELRTPLFSLGGFLELLQDEDLDEPTRREFLATMTEQVARLTKLATDLLDLSRLDSGRLRVEPERVELRELATTLVEEFTAVARARRHSLELVPGEDAAAFADPERALQIGRVLVENAIRHTPPGTPVRLVVGAPAELAVVDEGGGIPPEVSEQIFERFTRLESTTASGSGLGLAIARELASLMGGSIRLDSRPGQTTFTLVLPLAGAIPRENAAAPVA
jgi:signal transduction histidine kinase